MADIHELLAAIDPTQTDYTEWVSVGMAIKHEGGSASDWEQWSARDAKRYHQGECAQKWAGFIGGSGAPVTAGTLVEMAKRHGWTPQHSGGKNEAGALWVICRRCGPAGRSHCYLFLGSREKKGLVVDSCQYGYRH